MAEPRYAEIDGIGTVCEDCGVVVFQRDAHTRSHSIESSWAWMLAVLKTAHVAGHIHDKYDVVERIDSKKFDNWSADALAEVIKEQQNGPRPGPVIETRVGDRTLLIETTDYGHEPLAHECEHQASNFTPCRTCGA